MFQIIANSVRYLKINLTKNEQDLCGEITNIINKKECQNRKPKILDEKNQNYKDINPCLHN